MEDYDIQGNLKLVVRSGFFIFITFLFSKVFFYLYRVVIARYLGVEAYGLFSIIGMLFPFFATIANLGLERGIIRFISHYEAKNKINRIKGIILDSIVIVIPASIILSIIIYFSSEKIAMVIFHNANLIRLIKILSFSIPFASISAVIASYMQGKEKAVDVSVINNIINSLFKLVIVSLFIYFGFGLDSISYSYTFGAIATLVVYILSSKIYNLIFNNTAAHIDKKELIIFSLPLLGSVILSQIQGMVDTTFIGYFTTIYNVGLYNAALPIATLILIIPIIIYPLFIQQLTKLHSQNNKKAMNAVFKQIIRWTLVINLPLAMLIILFPGFFLNILFGEEFLKAETTLVILIIGYLIFALYMIFMFSLEVIKKTKFALFIWGIHLVSNIILDLILVPIYGINGAAISSVISIIIAYIILRKVVKKYFGLIEFMADTYKLFITALIILIPIYIARSVFNTNLIVVISSGIVLIPLYFIILIKVKFYNKDDIELIKAIKTKIKVSIKNIKIFK